VDVILLYVTQQARGLLQYQGRDRFLRRWSRARVRPSRDLTCIIVLNMAAIAADPRVTNREEKNSRVKREKERNVHVATTL